MNSSLSRRKILQGACCLPAAAALMQMPSIAHAASPTSPRTNMTADQALKALRDGNDAFMKDTTIKTEGNRDRRLEIAKGQTPFCILISCSDSRVPPELLFGRGLGELFIVRNAGNTVDTTALGSIEYGVSQLGVPLVVVMGHEKCGAVAAAVSVVEDGTVFQGAIGQMIEPIIPAVLTAKGKKSKDLLEDSVKSNIQRTVARLRSASEPALMNPIKAGTVKVVGAYYSLENGKVDFFDV
ncbi:MULTISPECIES: carbonic anhydrase [Pseudomonas syringae group]|uniref:carbonic anhydrase n=3 Tax=Pseudomonas viridiflava TaxID=33069 RepID=A0A1Y6JPB3_PSEVI|nr:carbonic anhydrase [Pseudomonas viridiflava]MCF8979029.1 carbonic anhydrase [Pseudomonas syringae]VVN71637.1 Carbonic anhydrase 2 [Pseudomonas fluorescens]MBI6680268.1 carbonic anhydrase [Pseudomonas viridiflava]MCQ9391290.1 carbonic anhydrase [Pseudomonas viridiflava]MDY0916188.1 carbonic anhydrase [Pseudomonas viridiflava]